MAKFDGFVDTVSELVLAALASGEVDAEVDAQKIIDRAFASTQASENNDVRLALAEMQKQIKQEGFTAKISEIRARGELEARKVELQQELIGKRADAEIGKKRAQVAIDDEAERLRVQREIEEGKLKRTAKRGELTGVKGQVTRALKLEPDDPKVLTILRNLDIEATEEAGRAKEAIEAGFAERARRITIERAEVAGVGKKDAQLIADLVPSEGGRPAVPLEIGEIAEIKSRLDLVPEAMEIDRATKRGPLLGGEGTELSIDDLRKAAVGGHDPKAMATKTRSQVSRGRGIRGAIGGAIGTAILGGILNSIMGGKEQGVDPQLQLQLMSQLQGRQTDPQIQDARQLMNAQRVLNIIKTLQGINGLQAQSPAGPGLI